MQMNCLPWAACLPTAELPGAELRRGDRFSSPGSPAEPLSHITCPTASTAAMLLMSICTMLPQPFLLPILAFATLSVPFIVVDATYPIAAQQLQTLLKPLFTA